MFAVFGAITLLFVIAVVARNNFNLRVCAICAGIAITWMGLLLLYKLDKYHDTALLALLMGQSIAGIFYLLKDRFPKDLRIFTLPFFLTLTAVMYALITSEFMVSVFAFLTVIWVVGWFVFTSRNDPGKKELAKATMDCCEGEK